MIKKIIASLVLVGVSSVAFAADNVVTPLQSGVYVENTAAGCSILRDRVTVNTSVGVTAVYNCMVALGKVNIGACHASGSQKPTDVPCVVTGVAADGTTPTYNGANCTAAGVNTVPPMQTSIAGRRAYTGSTTGGSVGQTSLGATTCTTAALTAIPGVAQ